MRQAPHPFVVIGLLAGALAAGCRNGQAGEAGTEATDESWRPLFDGTSFDGWRGVEDEQIPSGHWAVEGGQIRKIASKDVPTAPDGQPLVGGDIMTAETFSSFELSFEWKVSPGANSGVKYNVSQAMSVENVPASAALGFEYQVLDDERHPDALNGPNRQAGALYDLIGPDDRKVLRPVGEFNTGRILFEHGHGEHWLNGVKLLEYDVGSQRFGEVMAASKYAPVQGFADLRSGHVVLQDHGDDVWYRNIRIRVIEP
jgi:hypothetical protein